VLGYYSWVERSGNRHPRLSSCSRAGAIACIFVSTDVERSRTRRRRGGRATTGAGSQFSAVSHQSLMPISSRGRDGRLPVSGPNRFSTATIRPEILSRHTPAAASSPAYYAAHAHLSCRHSSRRSLCAPFPHARFPTQTLDAGVERPRNSPSFLSPNRRRRRWDWARTRRRPPHFIRADRGRAKNVSCTRQASKRRSLPSPDSRSPGSTRGAADLEADHERAIAHFRCHSRCTPQRRYHV